MLSIEITRECPLSCPGCYAYGDTHLGGGKLLSELNDFRGDALVNGVLDLVRKNKPMHVSLVGGEPLVRHRELSAILPALSAMNIFSLVVTSGVIPIPLEWMDLPRLRVAVSIDGLPEQQRSMIVAVFVAVYSAPFWNLLRERGRLSGPDAQEAVVWALSTLLRAAKS